MEDGIMLTKHRCFTGSRPPVSCLLRFMSFRMLHEKHPATAAHGTTAVPMPE